MLIIPDSEVTALFLRPEMPTHNNPGQRRKRLCPGLQNKSMQPPPCKMPYGAILEKQKLGIVSEFFDFVMGKAGNVRNVGNRHISFEHIPGDGNALFGNSAVNSGEFIVAGFGESMDSW